MHKTPKNFPTSEELKNCDTDSAALDRLSQLLTSKEQSEVSVKTDLISLNVTTEEAAPMASQDESLSSSNQNSEAQNNNKVFQELDDAFTELDQEMAKDDLEDDEETKLSRIFSAPTAIWAIAKKTAFFPDVFCDSGDDENIQCQRLVLLLL